MRRRQKPEKDVERLPGPSDRPPMAGHWLDQALATVLAANGVAAEKVDARSYRFRAVPLGQSFNKARTNILTQLTGGGRQAGSVAAYVDEDLKYIGTDQAVGESIRGRCAKGWQALRTAPLRGSISQAFCSVLELLGSPMACDARGAVGPAGAQANPDQSTVGALLDSAAVEVGEDQARRTYRQSVRQSLARELAVMTTLAPAGRAIVLWGPAGSGKDHLMTAAAWPLLDTGRVTSVLRVFAARLAAGRIFRPEIDAAFLTMLTEASQMRGRPLLLIQDLDVCLTGSPASRRVLCEAIDRGLSLLATVCGTGFLRDLAGDDAIRRRLRAVRLDPPDSRQTLKALEFAAAESPIPVARATMQVALRAGGNRPSGQPAAALDLLAGAIAQAQWRPGAKQVIPDDVFTIPHSEWPDGPSDIDRKE